VLAFWVVAAVLIVVPYLGASMIVIGAALLIDSFAS
jgi:hypothetical protein